MFASSSSFLRRSVWSLPLASAIYVYSLQPQLAASNAAAGLPELDIHTLVSSTQVHVKSIYNQHKEGFYILYDTRTKNPICVVEKLTSTASPSNNKPDDSKWDFSELESSASNKKTPTKRPNFFAESAVSSDLFRVQPKDYNDSRYDRGHMAPAADFSHDAQLWESTFTMANISPQAPLLNKGFWARFEAWIRNFLLKFIFEEMIVVTGPVFAPTFIENQWIYLHRTVGTFPKLVPIPSHFYKVIIGRRKHSNNQVVGAFLVPNMDTVNKADPIVNFLVRLSQLESLVGFRFFPKLIDEKQRDKLDNVVPEFRDLSVVLNAKNIGSVKGGTAQWHDIGDPKNSITILTPKYTSQAISDLSKKKNTASSLLQHFCECGVDCSRGMFEK